MKIVIHEGTLHGTLSVLVGPLLHLEYVSGVGTGYEREDNACIKEGVPLFRLPFPELVMLKHKSHSD